MGLIELAARRLEELRRAGIEPPHAAARPPGPVAVHEPARAAAAAPRPQRTIEIDLARLAREGFVTPDHPDSGIANEFRIIKRPLIRNASEPGAARAHRNLIMVTSSVPGEGKSFCALNLGISMAMELDRTVLLVDGDVARPSLGSTLGMRDAPGLLDALATPGADIAEFIVGTNVPKLAFLPTGTLHPSAAEMLASDATRRLLDDLATRYADRIVVFDSPPLLVTTESRALATRMGQIVFVVEAESTLRAEVAQALATIEECPLKLAVLNRARTASQGAYGYGYGDGYGHRHAAGKKGPHEPGG